MGDKTKKLDWAEVYLCGQQLVILGWPGDLPIPEEHHNCDAMGCGSAGPHVLARVPRWLCYVDVDPGPVEVDESEDLFAVLDEVAEELAEDGVRVSYEEFRRQELDEALAETEAALATAAKRAEGDDG